ncbi:hypothetical protein AB0O52_04775 [Arthrobacter sp. NPDC080073]|uniref:hypothetical protein n=1 Tax=Arthrobacter sp. NPDC080073 TaxID=3155919 RepID=UPI003418BAAA
MKFVLPSKILTTKGILVGNDAGWSDLFGRKVQVHKDGRTVRTGYVEAVTVAADALWIAAEGVEPRALYEKAQGYTILPVSGQEAAHQAQQDLAYRSRGGIPHAVMMVKVLNGRGLSHT